MASAKKLPSGFWRCQVHSHTEEITQPDGTIKKKRIYKSFTCDDPSAKGRRNYSASIQHAIGIPDSYIMQRGEWGNDGVLKSVYRHTMEQKQKK